MFTAKMTKLALAAAIAMSMAGAAMAAAPMAGTPAPGYFRLMVGAFEVTAVSDGTVELPVDQLLMQSADKTNKALAKNHLSSPLESSVNSYLINTGSKLILIDAGAGALYGPTLGKLIANIKASGYEPEQIDEIYITHFHPDHVGGLMVNGQRAFPNAIVRADAKESSFWLSQANMDAAPPEGKAPFQLAMMSVNPYVAAGKYSPYTGTAELTPGITAHATYGHTPGHAGYLVQSQGKKLLLIGDLIHVAAVQLDKPKVTIAFDSDADQAAETRKEVFKDAAHDGLLIGASHIQFPGIGHLEKDGGGFDWLPVNYTQMH